MNRCPQRRSRWTRRVPVYSLQWQGGNCGVGEPGKGGLGLHTLPGRVAPKPAAYSTSKNESRPWHSGLGGKAMILCFASEIRDRCGSLCSTHPTSRLTSLPQLKSVGCGKPQAHRIVAGNASAGFSPDQHMSGPSHQSLVRLLRRGGHPWPALQGASQQPARWEGDPLRPAFPVVATRGWQH